MLTPEDREYLRKAIRMSVFIWWAIAASVGIYVLIAHLGEDELHGASPLEPEVLDTLRNALFGVAVVTLLITPYITRMRLKFSPRVVMRSGPFESAAQYVRDAYAKLSTKMITGLALSESLTVYGFMLFIFGDSYNTLYAFSAGSLLGMLYYYPKIEALEGLALELRGKEGVFN